MTAPSVGAGEGRVTELWRYPVKSMQGERLEHAEVTSAGITGDRAWAVVDVETGKVASAKHPRKWGALLACTARTVGAPGSVEITLSDGQSAPAGPDAARLLSDYLDRELELRPAGGSGARGGYEGIWPDIEGIAPDAFLDATRVGRDQEGSLLNLDLADLAPGTFLDVAPLHVVAQSSLDRMRDLAAEADPDVRRFRPNVVVSGPAESGSAADAAAFAFAEDAWNGHSLRLASVEAGVVMPTMRCIMTTLAQPGLAGAPAILRTLARDHRVSIGGGMWACLGVYADVRQPGPLAVGDPFTLA